MAHPLKETQRLHVGDRVFFEEETRGYTVQAVSPDGRYVACTKPFAAKHTVLYSMLDVENSVRGVDDSIGNSLGYETPDDCQRAVNMFYRGDHGFSGRRRPIPLRIVKVKRGPA